MISIIKYNLSGYFLGSLMKWCQEVANKLYPVILKTNLVMLYTNAVIYSCTGDQFRHNGDQSRYILAYWGPIHVYPGVSGTNQSHWRVEAKGNYTG